KPNAFGQSSDPKASSTDLPLSGASPVLPLKPPDPFNPGPVAGIDEKHNKIIDELKKSTAAANNATPLPGKPFDGPPPPLAPGALNLLPGALPATAPVALDNKNDPA